MRDFRKELQELKKEWVKTWDDYSYSLRLEAAHELFERHKEGQNISQLCKIYGTKDRGTVIALLRMNEDYKGVPNRVNKAADAVPRPAWNEKTYQVEHIDEDTVTVIVPDVKLVPWSEKAAPLVPETGRAKATWSGGLFVDGDQCLQAEKLSGNKHLDL